VAFFIFGSKNLFQKTKCEKTVKTFEEKMQKNIVFSKKINMMNLTERRSLDYLLIFERF
jgi:hypothetical protein